MNVGVTKIIEGPVKHRISRNASLGFRARIVGYPLFAIMLMSVPDFISDPRRWILTVILLILPFIFYIRSNRATSGYHAELNNMLLEYFFGGILLASLEFRLWPSTISFVIGSLSTIITGGPRIFIKGMVLLCLGVLVGIFIFDYKVHPDTEYIPTVISIASVLAFVIFMGIFMYNLRLKFREAKQIIAREQENSQQLLLKVFPEAIIPRLNANENPIADEFADVTVLFSDIVGYTPMAEQLGPRKTVMLLNNLYKRFDQITAEHGVEKIETVGDGYLAVGGAPVRNDDHPESVASMALAMVDAAKQVEVSPGKPLQIRIGIHTGPIFAGVIGEHRFHYAIFGETVNVAARVQDHSQPGRILVSESAYKRIQNDFGLKAFDSVELKGHGPMQTYWLTGNV